MAPKQTAKLDNNGRGPRKDITGLRFGRLQVAEFAGRDTKRRAYWMCICDCGKEVIVNGYSLTGGVTHSCGCLWNDTMTKHGEAGKALEYNSWLGMVHRCTNPKDKKFPQYAGRGITVCSSWLNSYDTFVADMGRRPTPTHTLDRIDNDCGYTCGHCPECKANGWIANCRWATPKMQARNRRGNRLVTYNGKTATLSEWAERYQLGLQTLRSRLQRGWAMHKALTTPPQKY